MLEPNRIHVMDDGWRLWLDGLPLFGRAQFAVDTTLVSALHCDGTATPGAADTDGAALVRAWRRKERTHPELAITGAAQTLGETHSAGPRSCRPVVGRDAQFHSAARTCPSQE